MTPFRLCCFSFIKQDTVAVARFKTANLICMETFTDFAPMGRFTLRDEGKPGVYLEPRQTSGMELFCENT